jgi:hypothetical protein
VKALITRVAILALISGLPLAWWISRHKEAQQEIVRGDVTEEKTAGAQAFDLPANVLIIHPKAPGINPQDPITATRTDEQADYLATHILDWPTNSLNALDLEGLPAFIRALDDIEASQIKTDKVILWCASLNL